MLKKLSLVSFSVIAVALLIKLGVDHNFYRKELVNKIVDSRLCLPIKTQACISHPNTCDPRKEICTMNMGFSECKEFSRPCDAPRDWKVSPYYYQSDNFWLQ